MIKNFSNFISDKIDIDTNIFWFEKSNKYIIINDLLNSLILNKIDNNKYPLNKFSSEINELKPDNLKTIFNDIDSLLKECNIESKNKTHKESSVKDEKFPHHSRFKFNNRVVKIEYSNKNLRNLIDPKFVHIKSDDNEQIVFQTTSSAVNQLEVTNAATGNDPKLAAAGGDSNIDLALAPKGSGEIVVGTGSAASTITSSGAYDLILDTNSGTNSGTITITDGSL